MKYLFHKAGYLTLIIVCFLVVDVFPQRIGIGLSNPTRAILEVNGAAGAGSTSALFGGDGSGISLQRNFPAIGFNQYNDGLSRFLSTGYAALQSFDSNNGIMSILMLNNGAANDYAPTITAALTIGFNGNVGIKSNP